jgi:hypothetical protein
MPIKILVFLMILLLSNTLSLEKHPIPVLMNRGSLILFIYLTGIIKM